MNGERRLQRIFAIFLPVQLFASLLKSSELIEAQSEPQSRYSQGVGAKSAIRTKSVSVLS